MPQRSSEDFSGEKETDPPPEPSPAIIPRDSRTSGCPMFSSVVYKAARSAWMVSASRNVNSISARALVDRSKLIGG